MKFLPYGNPIALILAG